MIEFSTQASNTLDIFVTDCPGLVESCEVVDGISDHEIVLITSQITVDFCYTHLKEIPICGPRQALILLGKLFKNIVNNF